MCRIARLIARGMFFTWMLNVSLTTAPAAAAPLLFEANRGQVDARVKFLSRSSDSALFLTPTAAVLTTRQGSTIASARMEFVSANGAPIIRGDDVQPARTSYFLGDDSSRWRTNVPAYARVEYRELYPGVNLVFYGRERQLEFDLLVAPGAEPRRIAFRFRGTADVKIDRNGGLSQRIGDREIVMHAPAAYQEIDGKRRQVAARFVIRKKNVVAFRFGSYDKQRALIIDPVLSYSTYLGGSYLDQADAVAIDSVGNAYITGRTNSFDYPATIGSSQPAPGGGDDAFVTKVAPNGSIVYSTFLGGTDSEEGTAIAVDAAGAAYVTGSTASGNFPKVNPYQSTFSGLSAFFVTKLDPTGSSLVYSTYLGGSAFNYVGPGAWGIAVDGTGSAYVSGVAVSNSFPTKNAFQSTGFGGGAGDAYVAKLTPSGSDLVYASYLGGSGYEFAEHIALDASGNAYVTGATASSNFPTTLNAFQTTFHSTTGGFNAFVAKINSSGTALSYSTYLGGTGDDRGFGITVDASGAAYVAGLAGSTDFPTAIALQPVFGGGIRDAFVSKLNPSGSSLVYSTFIGGSGDDEANDIAVDGAGNAYVTGLTTSSNFPNIHPLQSGLKGPYDIFLSKVNAPGTALSYSTYLGGSGGDAGQGIAVDTLGAFVYVAGRTNSTDFPTLNAAQPSNGTNPAFAGLGFTDAVLVRLDSNASTPSADISIAKSDAPDPVTTWSNLTYTLSIRNGGPDAASHVTVNDPLPSSTLFVSASTTQGSCSGSSAVSCSLGTLANGGTATVTIVVTPTAEGQIMNTASVAADQIDPDSSNNTSTATTTDNLPPLYSAKGQRADVNDFLRFAAPTQSTTDLPAGTTSDNVIIYYGSTINPATFAATLGGAPFSGFTPAPGTSQRVTIPLVRGRNVLLLTVDGVRSDGRTATERDRLTFTVP